MAITNFRHKGDWLADEFEDNMGVIWDASIYGYGIDRWDDIPNWKPKYGLWRRVGPNQGKVAVGTFDSPQEVVAILKLILANEEQEQQQRRVQC